jgi:hypothetical protein
LQIYSDFSTGTDTDYLKYYTSGFLTLQQAIGQYAIIALPGRDDPNATDYSIPTTSPLPTAASLQADLLENIASLKRDLDALDDGALTLIDTVESVANGSGTTLTPCEAVTLVIGAAVNATDMSDADSVAESVAAALREVDPSLSQEDALAAAQPYVFWLLLFQIFPVFANNSAVLKKKSTRWVQKRRNGVSCVGVRRARAARQQQRQQQQQQRRYAELAENAAETAASLEGAITELLGGMSPAELLDLLSVVFGISLSGFDFGDASQIETILAIAGIEDVVVVDGPFGFDVMLSDVIAGASACARA